MDAALAVAPVGDKRKVRGDVDGEANLAVNVGAENGGQPPHGQQLVVHESGHRQHEAAVQRHLALEREAEQLLADERHLHLVVQTGDHALHAGDQHARHVLKLGRRVPNAGGQNLVLNGLAQRLRLLQRSRTKVKPTENQINFRSQ